MDWVNGNIGAGSVQVANKSCAQKRLPVLEIKLLKLMSIIRNQVIKHNVTNIITIIRYMKRY